jgi:site-specific DNA-methyltransferase (adenine-specific)
MQWCINFIPDDASVICDPYMGSGSTLLAARNLGYQAIGIEIDPEYCAIAVQRLKNTPLPLQTNGRPNNGLHLTPLPGLD